MLLGNPMVVRIVKGGSVRMRDMWIRMGYLGALILLVFIGLMAGEGLGQDVSMSMLAKSGAKVFMITAYGQVALVCLLAPLFMASAISQEQSAKTYDILLTTPLSNMQIVLGNLMGRLFFILALLASGLPLFAVLLIFGGVRSSSVFIAFGVAAMTAVLVGSVAVTMSVSRLGGRKAVFGFVISIAAFLLGAYLFDLWVLRRLLTPGFTTWLTPLHPLLVLESALSSTSYKPPSADMLVGMSRWKQFYLGHPFGAMMTIYGTASAVMMSWCAIVLRSVGRGDSKWIIWLKSKLRVGGGNGGGERRRKARHVTGRNPIAWRESHTRGTGLSAIVSKYGFVVVGLLLGGGLLYAYHLGSLPSLTGAAGGVAAQREVFQEWLFTLLLIEVLVITLVAIYMSAGCVSREREDGTLDLLLTTPMTQKQYVWGKLRGLVQFLSVMISVPVLTVAMVSVYTLVGHAMGWTTVTYQFQVQSNFGGGMARAYQAVLMLPESALLLALMLVPFIALCVAAGMSWSIKSKGVLGAVIPSVAIIGAVSLVLGFCGFSMAQNTPVIFGATINSFSPTTSLMMIINPWEYVYSFHESSGKHRIFMFISALIAAGGYSVIVVALLNAMVKNFDHTVRKLSGTG